jgi:hypothetical protein
MFWCSQKEIYHFPDLYFLTGTSQYHLAMYLIYIIVPKDKKAWPYGVITSKSRIHVDFASYFHTECF